MDQLLADLAAEEEALDGAIYGLAAEAWDAPSPAEGWTLRDCVSHLAESEEIACEAVAARTPPVPPVRPGGGLLTERQLRARQMAPSAVLESWRTQRRRLLELLSPLDPRERLIWGTGPMSARSFAVARLMETWSHGLDILDAAKLRPLDTDRLYYVAELGFRTRGFSYRNRGMETPAETLRVELVAPSGAMWTFGPPEAPYRISGTASEFCRVVTRRLHWRDSSLEALGWRAQEFLEIAQAYAGPPGGGRPPRGDAGPDSRGSH